MMEFLTRQIVVLKAMFSAKESWYYLGVALLVVFILGKCS